MPTAETEGVVLYYELSGNGQREILGWHPPVLPCVIFASPQSVAPISPVYLFVIWLHGRSSTAWFTSCRIPKTSGGR